ncbi:MAG: hypothetical protein ACRCZA_08455 [Shewanella sp.]|uniref:hypothetical protein n=1 Tax=Shewanella sp. TaxID=50422 RepID=UPI003F38EA48
MLKVIKPSETDLAPLMAQALDGVEPDDFLETFTDTIVTILSRDPKAYRSYGMYWYAIKAELIERGHLQFGQAVEQGFAEAYRYGSAVPLYCAAWAYRMHRIDTGLVYSAEHIAPTEDDPDYLYYLEDMEMEALFMTF